MAWCLVAYNNATPKLLLVASVAILNHLQRVKGLGTTHAKYENL